MLAIVQNKDTPKGVYRQGRNAYVAKKEGKILLESYHQELPVYQEW